MVEDRLKLYRALSGAFCEELRGQDLLYRLSGHPRAASGLGLLLVRLAFSGGACRWKRGDDVRDLVSRADEALYQAKAEGENTVVYLD